MCRVSEVGPRVRQHSCTRGGAVHRRPGGFIMVGDHQKRKFEHLFTRMDTNGDEKIDAADLEIIVQRVAEVRGPNTDAARLKDLSDKYRFMHQGMIAMADTDKSGNISRKEWFAYMDKVAGDSALYEQVIGGLTALFHQLIDRNGDGKNDLEDYKAFLRVIKADASQAESTFKKVDVNGDGDISLDDLRRAMDDFFHKDSLDGPGTHFFGRF